MARARNRKGQFTRGSGGGGRRRSSGGGGKTTIVRVAAPRAPAKRRSRRRSGGSGGKILGLATKHSRTSIALASGALGYCQKMGWLQKLPHVANAGPVTSFALLGWAAEELLHIKLPPLVHDMITSGLAISAFNLGLSGGTQIVGDDELEGATYSMPGGAVFFD